MTVHPGQGDRLPPAPTAHAVRGGLLFSFLFLLSTFAPLATAFAADDGAPAQRKRHGGLRPLTAEEMSHFLSERRNAVIGTVNKNGTPQLTPVVFYWDGTAFYISVTKETVKYRNIKRDPRVSLVVDDVLGHRTVIATGKARIQEQEVWDMTTRIMEKYYGREEAGPYLEQLRKQNRVLIILKPDKVQQWRSKPREEVTS